MQNILPEQDRLPRLEINDFFSLTAAQETRCLCRISP
jgi:hypothetical protein